MRDEQNEPFSIQPERAERGIPMHCVVRELCPRPHFAARMAHGHAPVSGRSEMRWTYAAVCCTSVIASVPNVARGVGATRYGPANSAV
jgi:hypothetical protein